MNLHPVIVLLSVTVGGTLFGIVGAFLAVPVAAMIAVFFRYFQDMTSLRAGEKVASDLKFESEYGEFAGRAMEADGEIFRRRYYQDLLGGDAETNELKIPEFLGEDRESVDPNEVRRKELKRRFTSARTATSQAFDKIRKRN